MPAADRNYRPTRTGKQPARKPTGGCACGHCWQQPSPDPMGRTHCDRCGCFTAVSTSRHRWCHYGMATWTKETHT